ncbi:MAG: TetR/AcrR family transcriptional regulator [Halieaceae bacterium]|jgi:AcrR family transcriptional regulator|nr:TetR/AcrR family transcriptional regulator [Halieaceae bacterium]
MGVAERRERERQARRDAVLEAARYLLLEKGFRGTTTKEVAKRCELSEATLFFYFKNKDEILVSLLFESIQFWAEGLEKLEKSRLRAGKLLDKIWEFHEEVNDKHPEYYVVSAYLAQPNALVGVSEEIKEQLVHLSGQNFQRLARLLERATGHSDGSHLADTLWSMFLGLMILRDSRINLGHEEVRTAKRDRAATFETLKCGLLATAGEKA